ncbi:MAG: hypothetical protein KA163_05110 [Bacteroidia bacterium]|nr:hypothetical protein [Bacteroidia bacterium]
MKLLELVDLAYQNANEVEFGNSPAWDTETFTSNWFSTRNSIQPSAPGLYWFISDAVLNNLVRPAGLPLKGCDFTHTSNLLMTHFGEDLITRMDNSNLKVVYNGHEKNVMGRVRSHFALNNPLTGALGLNYYSLSQYNWRLLYFTTRDLERIPEGSRQGLTNLLNFRTGRIALENAWRIKHGWPPLCKA